MFRLFIILCTGIFFSSCSQQKLTGSYSAGGNFYDMVSWYVKGKRKFFAANHLELKKDSTFHFNSCGCESTGSWKLQNDTVFLRYDTVRQFSDSTQLNCYTPPYFAIQGRALIGKNQGEYIEVLRK